MQKEFLCLSLVTKKCEVKSISKIDLFYAISPNLMVASRVIDFIVLRIAI